MLIILGEKKMCNVLVASSIVEVLEKMIQNQKVFTAFDVTKEARKIVSDTVLHRDVRSIVTNEFQIGEMKDYNRELCTLNISNTPTAFVYFPDSKSAADHPFVDDVSVVEDDEDEENGDDENIISITAEGRFNIPKKILDQIQPTGGSYDLMVNGDLHCRVSNVDGRIRLTANKVGLTTHKCRITVDTVKHKILVESI